MKDVKAFMAIKDGKIVKTCETTLGKDSLARICQKKGIEYDGIKEVPWPFSGHKGQHVNEFEKDWKLRPRYDRWLEGYITLPKDQKMLEDGTVIERPLNEQIANGARKLEKNERYDPVKDEVITEPEPLTEEQILEQRIAEKEREILRKLAMAELEADVEEDTRDSREI